MARKNNRKFTLAILSALSAFGNQSLAVNTGDKGGAVKPVSRELDRTTKMPSKENGSISAAVAILLSLGFAYEVVGNVVGLPTASGVIRYLAGKDKKSIKLGILPVIKEKEYVHVKEKEYIFIEKNPYVAAQNNGGYNVNKHEFPGMQEERMLNLEPVFTK